MNHMPEHSALMDRIYRYQRFIYDFSRKFYLFGRDRLLREMDVCPGERVLEMGCGTARNLIVLARWQPEAFYFGLDASNEMLKTAQSKIVRRELSDRITVKHCYAEEVDYRATFGLDEPFDHIFFSYSLSMIPSWADAIQAGLRNLKPSGSIHIVDFWDQKNWPVWFQYLLKRWLALFHVRHEPELIDYLSKLNGIYPSPPVIRSIFGRYALITSIQRL